MLIYLDTNVFGRPLDDRSQMRVDIEAQASLAILSMIEQKKCNCLSSDILKLEVARTQIPKRIHMQSLINLCSSHIFETDNIKNLALKINQKSNIEARDALHLASACIGKAEYFITCDDEITQKAKKIEQNLQEFGYNIKIINVLDFIKEVEK